MSAKLSNETLSWQQRLGTSTLNLLKNTVTLPDSWSLRCFGNLRVERGDHVIERFRTQKTAALLVLLAFNGKQSRERLCTLLWPDANPESARNSLSVALSSLRRDMGEDVLNADRQDISLVASKIHLDVHTFDEALKKEDFAQAVELYSGHLLPGFYEDPIPALAREYEEKARTVFASRLEELEQVGDFTSVLSVARRALALFGEDERWMLAQMRTYRGKSEFDAALRVYENWGRSVRKNGETTSETARALAKAIRRDKEQRDSKVTLSPLSLEATNDGVHEVEPAADGATVPEKNSGANFPAQWTQFFGRETERDTLRSWLQNGDGFVTLSGAGGSGKTRLAIETVREIAHEWDGAYFVPLAAILDPDLIYGSIRDALALPPSSEASPLQQLESALAERRSLLILDNFEQLVEGGVALLQELRKRLPRSTFIITSRILLNLPGEREFPVSPLPTPLQNTSLDSVRECASAALFCDRAGITLDGDNAEIISALCRRLDGIPLALELAAARSKMLSPAQILERVGRHPNFLQSREVGLPARHKTLRAAISWSVELLPPDLRRLFTQLSLFRGGWSLEAIEQICDEPDALDALTQLRESSLIVAEKDVGEARFRMLETLREFGGEELQGAERARTERAFFDYFLELAQHAAGELQGPHQKDSLSRLETEQDNIRAALTWARKNDEPRGLLLATSLLDYWETRLRLDEARHWLETFVEATSKETEEGLVAARARALSGIGRLAWYSSDVAAAQSLLEQGLEVAQQTGDTAAIIYAMRSLARVAAVTGGYERACELGHESIRLSRELGDTSMLIESLVDTGFADMNVARFESAANVCEEAMYLAREAGDDHALALSLLTLAIVLMYGKRIGDVLPLVTECEVITRSMGSLWELVSCLSLRAFVLSKQGNFTEARRASEESLRLIPSHSLRSWNGFNNLWSAVFSIEKRGDTEDAVYLLGAIEALRDSIGYTLLPFMIPEFEEVRASMRHKLGDDQFEVLWSRGSQLTPEEAVEYVLSSEG